MSQKIHTDLLVKGSITLNTNNAGVDTDKFLVQDSNGKIAFRTGSEMLLDLGAGGSSSTTYSETPSGVIDGVNTEYTLTTAPSNSSAVIVLLDGVVQYNNIDYTISGSSITFLFAPETGSSIFAYYNIISGGGGGTTNLSYTAYPTYGIVNSDTGTGATMSLADNINSGLLTPGDFIKLSTLSSDLSNKQPLLNGTGFVKSTAGVISYDNSAYYLASNPSGYTTNTGTVTGTSTIGYVSFWGTTSSIAGSSSLFWDNTNEYLGIGTATPATPLHVRSTTSVGLARIQGLGDVDNYSVLELWDDTGASKWQFAHKASVTYPKGFTFAHWNGSSWIQPVALLDSGRTLIGVGTLDDVVATNLLQVGGYVRASGYRISSGLATQFLKADGTTDSSTYLTSVGISNLTATGTPSATTYLRGDNTWATVSGGGGSPGGTVNEVQYNDGAGGFAGAANVEINTGNLKLVSTTDPAVPTGGLIYYSKAIAGRVLPKIIGPSGIDTIMQVGLHGNSVFMVSPSNATTTPNVIGGAITTATTISHQQTIASANPWQATRRTRFQTSTTAGNATGARTAYVQWYRGSATGFGGFWFRCQLGMNINLQGGQKFVGLCASTGALAGDPSALLNMCGMGYDAADLSTGSWSFMYNDGTGTATKVNLGSNALRNTTSGYDLVMYMAPGGSELFVRITNLDTNVVVLDTSYTTLLPVANTGMAFAAQVRNGAVAAADNLEIAKVYIETDY